MNNISVIMIAHNKKEIIKSQIEQLSSIHNISMDSITIVDNHSSDNLCDFLVSQSRLNYIICDDKIENYSLILNTCISEFVNTQNDILILDPDSFLLPETLKKLSCALNPDNGIYAVCPQNILDISNDIHSFSAALNYVNNTDVSKINLFKIIKPEINTILLSHKLLSEHTLFDSEIISDELCLTDFCINNILNDQFTYMADNVYQYYIGNHNSYYFPTNRNCDLAYIRQKWHMNYINTIPSSNLISMINEPIDKELNVLEIGCDCGATLLAIQALYPNSTLYGIEINPISAEIASHIASVKTANIEESVGLWNGIKFDYILFGDVLEHLHNPSKVIHNCRHILKKKGKIISSIPNLMHFTVLHELINGNFHYTDTGLLDKTHIHFFTYNEIVKMYEENDFNVINTVASNVTPMLSKKDSEFIDALTKLSSHKNDMLFKAFQYITLAEIKDTKNN